MKRVLVTGASGFVGRQTLPILLDMGFSVHAVCNKNSLEIARMDSIAEHRCDLLDRVQRRNLFLEVRPSHLLHLAWFDVHDLFWTAPENLQWVGASIEILDDFREAGGHRVVFAGSCAEYDWTEGTCFEDSTPLKSNTLYGICKHGLHHLFADLCRHYVLSGAWGRVFFLYGPYEKKERLVPYVINSILRGEKACCTSGHQARDYLYVEDAARAFVELLASDAKGAFNIASGCSYSVREVATRIARMIGRPGMVEFGALPLRDNDAPLVVGDIGKLTSQVGWRALHTLDDGLEETIRFWRKNLCGPRA